MFRVISKATGFFLRDDLTYTEESEIGLKVTPAQGLYRPKWDGEQWVEDMSAEEIEALKASVTHEPTAEERLAGLEQAMIDMMGGMF